MIIKTLKPRFLFLFLVSSILEIKQSKEGFITRPETKVITMSEKESEENWFIQSILYKTDFLVVETKPRAILSSVRAFHK